MVSFWDEIERCFDSFSKVLAKKENREHVGVVEFLSYPALNARGPNSGTNYYTIVWAVQPEEPGEDLQRAIVAE